MFFRNLLASIFFITLLTQAQISPIIIGKSQLPLHVIEKLNYIGKWSYSTEQTMRNSFEIATYCIQQNIPGDFVECGVAAGAQIGAMAYARQLFRVERTLHLFDSFEGIPLAGPNDDSQPGIEGPITHNTNVENLDDLLISSGISVSSVEAVKHHMRLWGIDQRYLVYHKGWFQHVLPTIAPQINKIALLRLDGDLYESTKVCLEYLYPKVALGGFVIIDDYALKGCRNAVHEYLDKHGLHPVIIPIEGGCGPVYWQVDSASIFVMS